jgi:hypothetical protein
MPRLLLVLATLVLAVWLAGCATLSRSECEAGNWREIGAADGSYGYPASRFDMHVKACTRYEVAPDRTLYLAGRDEGLVSYCRLERAAREGVAGRTNYKVCSGELGLSFDRVYDEGRDVYRARSDAADIRSEINDVSGKLAAAADPSARIDLRRDIADLVDKLARQEEVIARQQTELRLVLAEQMRRLEMLGIKG